MLLAGWFELRNQEELSLGGGCDLLGTLPTYAPGGSDGIARICLIHHLLLLHLHYCDQSKSYST